MKADPQEVRNLAFPGTKISSTEREQLNRLKAKLLAVTSARLGPLSGFKWDIDISSNITAGSGRAVGLPIGSGNVQISWEKPVAGQVKGTFAVSARTGQIVGTTLATFTVSNNTITYTGTARITGGTGAYRGFTSVSVPPLSLRMTSSGKGAVGRLALAGRVTTARANGKLILTPLNPYTGM